MVRFVRQYWVLILLYGMGMAIGIGLVMGR
jgi:hypothetical protein